MTLNEYETELLKLDKLSARELLEEVFCLEQIGNHYSVVMRQPTVYGNKGSGYCCSWGEFYEKKSLDWWRETNGAETSYFSSEDEAKALRNKVITAVIDNFQKKTR